MSKWGITASNLNNGHEPTSSSIADGSWHDYDTSSADGTSWVQYDRDAEVTVDSMSVYWMSDSVWSNRIPKSAKVEYKDADGNWQTAATYDATVMSEQVEDQYNVLPFDQEVITHSIRLTMERNTDDFPTNYVMNAKNTPALDTTGHQWLGELIGDKLHWDISIII